MSVKEEKQLANKWWKNLPDSEKELVCAIYYREHVDHMKVNATQVYILYKEFECEEVYE
jgi:hypothetical protein